MKTETDIDTFSVTSGFLVVGDPCYGTNRTVPALNGSWTARVVTDDKGDLWGERVVRLVVQHVDFNPSDTSVLIDEVGFGVDSGQAGVFDRASYGSDGFYDACCEATLSRGQCGCLRGGFVASSGYGDGWYSAEISSVSGNAIRVEMAFVEED